MSQRCDICEEIHPLYYMSELHMFLCQDCYERAKKRHELLVMGSHYLGDPSRLMFAS